MRKKKVSIIPLWLILVDVVTVGLWVFRDKVFEVLVKYTIGSFLSGNSINTGLLGKLYKLIPVAAVIAIAITIIIILANLGKKKQAAFIKDAMSEPTVTAQQVPTVVSGSVNGASQISSNPNEGHMNLF